jgi:hypothetical protein
MVFEGIIRLGFRVWDNVNRLDSTQAKFEYGNISFRGSFLMIPKAFVSFGEDMVYVPVR